MTSFRAFLAAATVLTTVGIAPALAGSPNQGTPDFGSVGAGVLNGSLAARPTNGEQANTSLMFNSGVTWLGGATNRIYTNVDGNQTTWLGNENGGGWQAADIYSELEVIATPGSGIAAALASRSMDNTASNSYTIYDYCESDGSYNGGVNRSCENAYFFAWNRHDAGITTGSHYGIGLEIDTENEEPLQDQGSYALGAGSFTSNLWLACGGDWTATRTPTPCPAAISILSQDYVAGALYSKGIIFAADSFVYNHGYTGDLGIMMEMPANGVLSWVVPTTGDIAGVIGSIATGSSNPIDLLFYNSGVEFTNSLKTPVVWIDPYGNLTAAEHLNANIGANVGTPTANGVYYTLDSAAGQSKEVVYESQGATVDEVGATGTVSGNNTGDDYFVDAWSDAGAGASSTPNSGGSGYGVASGTMTWAGANCAVPPVLNVSAVGGVITAVTGISVQGSCTQLPSSTATNWTPGGGLGAGAGASFNIAPASSFLFHDMDCVRAVGVCMFPQGIVVGGELTGTTDTTGWMGLPYYPGVPTGVPSFPVNAVGMMVNTNSLYLNFYIPGVGPYHIGPLVSGAM